LNVAFGSGNATLIYAGENTPDSLIADYPNLVNVSSEDLHVAADTEIKFWTACQASPCVSVGQFNADGTADFNYLVKSDSVGFRAPAAGGYKFPSTKTIVIQLNPSTSGTAASGNTAYRMGSSQSVVGGGLLPWARLYSNGSEEDHWIAAVPLPHLVGARITQIRCYWYALQSGLTMYWRLYRRGFTTGNATLVADSGIINPTQYVNQIATVNLNHTIVAGETYYVETWTPGTAAGDYLIVKAAEVTVEVDEYSCGVGG
jgi:hypothetical protein